MCHVTLQVIQRRLNGGLDFDRDWEAYKEGFGDKKGEFWLGQHLSFNSSTGSTAFVFPLSY